MRTATGQYRLPAQPLFEVAAYIAGKPLHETPYCVHCKHDPTIQACMNRRALAEAFNTTMKVIDGWKQKGLPINKADVLATELGYHPSMIWGLHWADPDD